MFLDMIQMLAQEDGGMAIPLSVSGGGLGMVALGLLYKHISNSKRHTNGSQVDKKVDGEVCKERHIWLNKEIGEFKQEFRTGQKTLTGKIDNIHTKIDQLLDKD